MLAFEEGPLSGRVYRVRPGKEVAKLWASLGGTYDVPVAGQRLRADALPAIVGESFGRTYALLLALVADDLAVLGLTLQPDLCRPGLGQEMLGMAEAVARQMARQGLLAFITNTDVVPLYFLQAQGFRLHEVRHLPEGGFGYRGLPRTHELILRRGLPSEGGSDD